MQAEHAGEPGSSEDYLASGDAGAATAARDAADPPLLIDRIECEQRALSFSAVGQALMTIGFIAPLALVLATILSGPSLESGWEGAWYIPRGEIFFILPISLALFITGGILYLVGRHNGTD